MLPNKKTSLFSFTKLFRITHPKQFQHVLQKGRKIGHGLVFARFAFNGERNARVGFIIPKKTIPTAILRNYVKRINRERFRQLQSELSAVDLVIIVSKEAKGCSKADLSTAVGMLWEKIKQISLS